MKKVRITVKRIARYDDLIAQYENPIEHACSMHLGQSFLCKSPCGKSRTTLNESPASMEIFYACHSVAPRGARMARLNQLLPMEASASIGNWMHLMAEYHGFICPASPPGGYKLQKNAPGCPGRMKTSLKYP